MDGNRYFRSYGNGYNLKMIYFILNIIKNKNYKMPKHKHNKDSHPENFHVHVEDHGDVLYVFYCKKCHEREEGDLYLRKWIGAVIEIINQNPTRKVAFSIADKPVKGQFISCGILTEFIQMINQII